MSRWTSRASVTALAIAALLALPAPAGAEADAAREAMVAGSYRQAAAMLSGEAARAKGDPISGPHLRYLHGRSLQLAGDHRGAVASFERLIADFPDSPWVRKARFCRSDSLAELDRVEEAAEVYRAETEALLEPARRDELAAIFLEYAHAAFEPDEKKKVAPDYGTAQILFATVLELEPSDAVRHEAEHYHARCQLELGDLRGAQAVFAGRLDDEDDPMPAADRFHLARAYGGDVANAARQFHLLIERHPDDPLAGDALWEAALLLAPEESTSPTDPERAVEDLRALVARFPDHEHAAEAHLRVARVLVWAGRQDRAVDAYREFVDAPVRAEDEERPRAMVELAELLERLGRDDDAIEVYRRYSAEYPTHEDWPDVQVHLSERDQQEGYERYRDGDLDGAAAALARHADAHPAEDAEARYLIGMIHYREGRVDEAIEAFEAVSSKFPDHWAGSRADYALALIQLQEKRDADRAREHLEHCTQFGGVRNGDCWALLSEMDSEGLDLYVDRPLRTNERPAVWMQARNLDEVELTLHRVDPEILMRKEGSVEAMDSLDVELIEPDQRWEERIDGAAEGLSWSGAMALPVRGPGVYVVGATGKTLRAQIQVVISDITVATFRHEEDVVVYVQDRRSGAPVTGARVLLSDGTAVFEEGRTGRDGTFVRRGEPGGDPLPYETVALALKGRHMATARLSDAGATKPEELPVASYVYTDRSAYRPGGEVGYRAALRRVHDRRHESMAGDEVRVRMLSPAGWVLAERTATLDRFGCAGGTFALAGDAGVGSYRVVVEIPVTGGHEQVGQASFQITEAAPSRRLIEVDFDRAVYVLGDEVEATVTATTYTGEPIVGVRLGYRWGHEDEQAQSEPTDEDGRVVLTTSTLNHGGLHSVQLTAHLPGEPVQVTEARLVRDAEFTLALQTDRDTLRPGEALQANLTIHDHEGEGVATPLTLSLYHEPQATPYDEWEGNPFAVPLWERSDERSLVPPVTPAAEPTRTVELATDADGVARQSWELTAAGSYRVVARARDGRDAVVHASRTVTVLGDEGPREGLALLADEVVLPAGGTARAQVVGGGTGRALAILEADGIAAVQLVRLDGDWDEVAVPLQLGIAPNARLTVVAVRDDRVLSGSVDLSVEAHLDVALEGLPEEAEPGTTVEATIQVRDEAGAPVDAQVSVAVIDASLLAQFPENRGSIAGRFLPDYHTVGGLAVGATRLRSQGPGMQIDAAILAELERQAKEEARDRRRAEAEPLAPEELDIMADADETYWLEGEAYGLGGLGTAGYGRGGGGSAVGYGTAGGVIGGVLGGEGRPGQVERFRAEAALWVHDLETGSDGDATLAIPLPKRAARWKVIVVAVDTGLRSGETDGELVAREPLSVVVAPPPYLREGDRPALVADLTSDAGGTVRLEGAVGGTPLAPVERTLPAGALDAVALDGVAVDGAGATRDPHGALVVPFALSLSGPAGRAHDELASRLVVADRPLERWRAGTLQRSADLLLEAPEGARGDLQLVVELGPGDLSGAMAMALTRPTVCLGSPYTSAHVAFATTALLDGAPGRLPAAQEELVRSLARTHAERLIEDPSSQGQQWTRPGRGHDGTLTAYGYVALVRAARLDLLPAGAHEAAQDRAAEARQVLLRQLREETTRPPSYQALLLYALSFEEGDDAAWSTVLTRLLRSTGASDPRTLGLLVTAAVQFGMAEDAAGSRGELEQAVRDAVAAGQTWSLAPAAEGLAALDPGSDALPAAVTALEEHLARPWLPTSSVAQTVSALARIRGGAATPVAVRVDLPDGTTQRIDFSADPRPVRVEGIVADGQRARVHLELSGRGPLRYRAGLVGDPAPDGAPPDDPRWTVERRYRRPDIAYHGVPLAQGYGALSGAYVAQYDELQVLPVGRSTAAELRIRLEKDQPADPAGTVWILEEMIPAGTTVEPGSIQGALFAEVRDDRVVAYLDGAFGSTTLRYRLVGATPGTYTAPGARLRRMDEGTIFEVGPATELVVSAQPPPPGPVEPLVDGVEYPAGEFTLTPDELYELGQRLCRDERWADCAPTYEALLQRGALRNDRSKVVGADLLEATVALGDPAGTLRAFEMLKERDPAYQVPFDQIVAVAKAYEQAGEHRQALRVYRGTLAARFLTEARLGKTLEQRDLVLPSLRFMYDLSVAYPDLGPVQNSLFHLPQIVADRAEQAETDPAIKARGYSRETLLATSADWMLEFAARYPESPLAEEAGFQLAGTHLELERYDDAISVCRTLARRFPEGSYLDGFLYMEGYAHRARGDMGTSLRLLGRVADGSFHAPGGGAPRASEQQPLARYAIAQIHDAAGRPEQALEYYRLVSGRYRDAAEAVAQMEQVVLATDDVHTVPTSQAPALDVRSRNLDDADLLLYQVDLMRLLLREKNLASVAGIRLAGIEPIHRATVALRGGRLREATTPVSLPLKEPGAYLVVLKGEQAGLSSMVLYSDLDLVVQEDRTARRARVTVTTPDGAPVEDAHVKVIGSDHGIVSGDTDLRGVFAADGVNGAPTVIVRKDEHYALFRGAAVAPPPPAPSMPSSRAPEEVDLLRNLREQNVQQRMDNRRKYDKDYFEQNVEGVMIDDLE